MKIDLISVNLVHKMISMFNKLKINFLIKFK